MLTCTDLFQETILLNIHRSEHTYHFYKIRFGGNPLSHLALKNFKSTSPRFCLSLECVDCVTDILFGNRHPIITNSLHFWPVVILCSNLHLLPNKETSLRGVQATFIYMFKDNCVEGSWTQYLFTQCAFRYFYIWLSW